METNYLKKTSACFNFILILITGLTITYASLEGTAECGETVDRIVAVVNDDIITLSELNELFAPFADKIKSLGYPFDKEQELLFKVREEKINQLIEQKLADQEIKRLDIKIEDKEIESVIERIKARNAFTDEQLREALIKEGSTMEAFHKQLQEDLLRNKLINYQIKSKIVITPEDIKAYYDAHSDQYAGNTTYHLRNIVMAIPPFATSENKQAILNKMEDVLSKFKEGAPFQELAKTYSEGPQAASGGDLGMFSLTELAPQLQEAISGLKQGEATSIIDTDFGYQIFFVDGIVQKNGKSIMEVSAEIEEKLYQNVIDEKYKVWLEDLKKQAHIKIIL